MQPQLRVAVNQNATASNIKFTNCLYGRTKTIYWNYLHLKTEYPTNLTKIVSTIGGSS